VAGEPRDHTLCLEIPQQDDVVIFASPEDLLTVRTERDFVNATVCRVAPGADRVFHIGIPDLDLPFRVAGDDSTIGAEQRTPDGAVVWELADDMTGIRVPEPGRLIDTGGQKGPAIRTEHRLVGLGVMGLENATLAGPPVP
jgi:hypothetical protein